MSGGGRDARTLGIWGEKQVAEDLERKGFQILETNWRCRQGEIDLIVSDDKYLCFVEVKLRKNDKFASARSFVDGRKQKKLRISAELYLMEHPSALQPRFDVAEVYAPAGTATVNPRIIYWENAF